MFRIVFWDVLPCKMIVIILMMEAVRTSETSRPWRPEEGDSIFIRNGIYLESTRRHNLHRAMPMSVMVICEVGTSEVLPRRYLHYIMNFVVGPRGRAV
jgi:hypothetical protein